MSEPNTIFSQMLNHTKVSQSHYIVLYVPRKLSGISIRVLPKANGRMIIAIFNTIAEGEKHNTCHSLVCLLKG